MSQPPERPDDDSRPPHWRYPVGVGAAAAAALAALLLVFDPAVRDAIAPRSGAEELARNAVEIDWCDAPVAFDGPFQAIPGARRLWVCQGEGLVVRAEGGECAETFSHPQGRLERDQSSGAILVVDQQASYRLGCLDGSWTLIPGP